MDGVVLLHAFPYNPRMWAPQVEALRGKVPLLAPHYLGLPLEEAAQKTLDLMDREGLKRAVFVGLSMGGYLAFRIYERAKERVLGLVLADTRSGPDSEEARRARYALRERVLKEGVAFLPETLLSSHLGRTGQGREVWERAKQIILEATPQEVAESLLTLAHRPDSTPLLSTMEVPVLLLFGEEDTLTPPEEGKAMARSLKDARLLILPEAGHLSNLENPKAFNTALLGFLLEVGLLRLGLPGHELGERP
ncbi:MAG: alpha/beta fold hydrolase [Thermaceae bacterium]